MVKMIEFEVEQMEQIEKEVELGVINFQDVENRLSEEEKEMSNISLDDIKKTVDKNTNSYWWLSNGFNN